LHGLVGVQDLEAGISDHVPYVLHLGPGKGNQLLCRCLVALQVFRGVALIVGVNCPERIDDDVALGGKVGVEGTLGDTGIVGYVFNRYRIKTACIE